MKSSNRFLAFTFLLVGFALSCTASATSTEEQKTIIDNSISFDFATVEIADFRNITDFAKKVNDFGTIQTNPKIDTEHTKSSYVNQITEQVFAKIKRFRNARDGL